MNVLATEIPKAAIGWIVSAVFALFVLCVVTIYQSHEHMLSSGDEAIVEARKDADKNQRLGEFAKDSSPLLERSLDRVLKLKGISAYKKEDKINEQTANSWHSLSAISRLEATKDLVELDRYSEDTFPLSTTIKDGLRTLLNSEIKLWENFDRYTNDKSAAPGNEMADEEAFQVFTKAFLEHSRSIGSIQSLYIQTADRILIEKKNAQSKYERHIADFDQTRRKFKLAFFGLVMTSLIMGMFALVPVYPVLRAKLAGLKKKPARKR